MVLVFTKLRKGEQTREASVLRRVPSPIEVDTVEVERGCWISTVASERGPEVERRMDDEGYGLSRKGKELLKEKAGLVACLMFRYVGLRGERKF